MNINFKYEFCGLMLDIEATLDAGEPQTLNSPGMPPSAEIEKASYKGDELELDEMDIYEELQTAAFIAATEQYENQEPPMLGEG